MITYIEDNILEPNKKAKNPQADKAKVLRETKLLPKLILRIESFNKFVIWLGKKTGSDLSNHLHLGTVRDFRIKTTELKNVLNQTIEESHQIEMDETQLDEADVNADDDDGDDGSRVIEQVDSSEITNSGNIASNTSTPTTSNDSAVIEDHPESDVTKTHLVMSNLAKINEKAKKRKRKSNESEEAVNENIPKKRMRRKPKIKINKSVLAKSNF